MWVYLVGGIPCRWESLRSEGVGGHECKEPGLREAVLGICKPFAVLLPPHCGSGEHRCQAEGSCLVQSVSEELWCQASAWCKPVQHFLCKCPSGRLRLPYPCREGWYAFMGSNLRMMILSLTKLFPEWQSCHGFNRCWLDAGLPRSLIGYSSGFLSEMPPSPQSYSVDFCYQCNSKLSLSNTFHVGGRGRRGEGFSAALQTVSHLRLPALASEKCC